MTTAPILDEDTGQLTVEVLFTAADWVAYGATARVRDTVRRAVDQRATEHDRTPTFRVRSHVAAKHMDPRSQGFVRDAVSRTEVTHYLWTDVWNTIPAVAPAVKRAPVKAAA